MTNKATQFKKGYDARRYVPVNHGLVEYYAKLGDLHRAQSLDAANYVYSVMMNKSIDPKLRFTAAQEIMNRAAGRPVDVSVIATIDTSGAKNVSKLSNTELTALIHKLTGNSGAIDAEFVEVPDSKG